MKLFGIVKGKMTTWPCNNGRIDAPTITIGEYQTTIKPESSLPNHPRCLTDDKNA